ncbi:MAG: hypothetical protein CMJ72_12780 [Planctomycetaceae bacterium]|nr:hypothetical protein [Planctomycetaceae bacterium]
MKLYFSQHFHLFLLLSLGIGTNVSAAQDIERGVSRRLASQRKATLSEIEYDVSLELQKTKPIRASIEVRFHLDNTASPLVLDFNAPEANIQQIQLNQTAIQPEIKNGHIIIPQAQLQSGKQALYIDFIAGNLSLNRNEEFLYTLLVPDRASTVFPCFDQPDLKAKFRLQLDLPTGWVASANGALLAKETIGKRTRVQYQQTKPISTYLFAFAAGNFQTVTRKLGGRTMTMYHRETDQEKVERNLNDIFMIHTLALDWMEDYTKIDYPFEKFDFVLIPSFQYGGMEHIGNIFYKADKLLLEKSATLDQKLSRASLIAHETSHMWFGNLVTMEWFDDVWLKEVFANFMAAKIVHPRFPMINHDLGFMLKHHPQAYGEDRSRGTYPIQQKLDNLKNAGTLYGGIIYKKAPIVMRQLETMIGRAELQKGLQEYLAKFSYGNAVWDDLIDILDKRSDVNLKQWSTVWVKEAGTPEIDSRMQDQLLAIKQTRATKKEKFWAQQIDIKVVADGKTTFQVRAMIDGETTEIPVPVKREDYDFYLANGSELGYGYFRLDNKSKAYLLDHITSVENDVTRGAAWLALYESLIRGQGDGISATRFLNTLKAGLDTEQEPLNRQNILRQLSTVFWKFLTPAQRMQYAPSVEAALWKWIDSETDTPNGPTLNAKSTYYKSLVKIASTADSIQRLYTIWETESDVNGLPLAETDFMTLAYELAIRRPNQSDKILATQLARLENEDRKKRFAFVVRSLSPDQTERDTFFDSLKAASNRRPERWVLDGLEYLHHPLRAVSSEKYILPSLELLEEIQVTGDIFFPKRWLDATFSGHRSPAAAQLVTQFLADRPEYPQRLKNKILQAADLLLKVGQESQPQ